MMSSRNLGVRAALVVGVATLVTFAGPVANATSGDGTQSGADVSGPGDQVSPEMVKQGDLKSQVAEAYVQAKYHGGSAAAYEAAYRAYKAAHPRAAKGLGKGDDFKGGRGKVSARSAQFAMNRLGVNHEGQAKNYYCGPASGKMMLRWLNAGNSKYTGAPLKQITLADAHHMRTDINGKTSWASGLFRIGINKWREGSPSGYYIDDPSPSAAEFKSLVVYSTDHGLPVAADTVELAGSSHYNNHPLDQTIGHWIVVEGYANYGDGTYYVDPGTSVFPQANEEFGHVTGTFASRYLQHNGVTW